MSGSSGPIPVNLAAIEAKSARADLKQIVAMQVESEESFTESIEMGFNPASAEREQARLNKFRPLEQRKTHEAKEGKKIQEVEKKAEEDLADSFNRRDPELPSDRLRDLRGAIREESTPDEILEQVDMVFGEDATLADTALEYLEGSTQGELREKVIEARARFNTIKGREIIAGRNIDSVAKFFHKKGIGQNPTELRNLYRDITGNPREHNVLFSELTKKYSFDKMKEVVSFLLKALGYDLKAKGSSIQHAELIRLMTDCRNLQSILWIYLFFKSRLKLVRKLYKKRNLPETELLGFEKMAQEFITLVEERYPSVLKLLKQAEKMGLLDDDAKVVILSQFRDAMHQLSPRLYKSLKHRQDLLLVILETLEELEPEEEEDDESI